jgi:archaeosine synthase
MLEVLQEDWLARIVRFSTLGFEVEAPEVLHIMTDGVESPSYARAFVTDQPEKVKTMKNALGLLPSGFFEPPIAGAELVYPALRGAEQAPNDAQNRAVFSADRNLDNLGEIVTIGDALPLSREPRRFAKFFAGLRRKVGPGRLIYAPGLADPVNLALLCYFGVDLVDSYGTMVRSSLGQVLIHGRVVQADSEELDKLLGMGKDPDRKTILRHNLRQLEHELAVVRDAIRSGTLRQLVELRARHQAWMVEALRFADLDEFDEIERWIPIQGGEFLASSKESLWRPDIRRYRERVMTRYSPPQSPEVLVIMPCSAKKPYSTSKSHRMFREAIWNSGIGSSVHEVIVTSPLGIVPRELETVYPAQQYDIPVTGHWDEDERKICQMMLKNLLEKRKYERIVAHLDEEMEFVGTLLASAGAVHTGGESVTKKENLAKLTEALGSFKDDISKPSWNTRTLEDMTALASYQFGEASKCLMEGAAAKGGFPMIKIFRDKKQLASLVPDKGTLSLTLDGGEAIARSNKFGVEIDDFVPKTNIFAVGVKGACGDIRIGDEVYVHHGGEVRAVGSARMNGQSMTVLQRGEAVHLRHHR